MIKKIKKWWKQFKKDWLIDLNPYESDEQISKLHGDITYLWACIEGAEFPHEFMIIENEINHFVNKYKNYGFDDLDDVVRSLRQRLSERIDQVQDLTHMQ